MAGIATNTHADMPWREFYVDERLQKIIELALENNRDLRAAGLRIEKTRELYRIQRAELFPTLDISGLGTSQQLFTNVETFEKSVRVEYYNINVGFSSYELDFFGRIRSLKTRALEEYLATGQARRGLQISLMAEIATSYLNLAAACERLGLASDTLVNREASLALVRRRLFPTGMWPALRLLFQSRGIRIAIHIELQPPQRQRREDAESGKG